VHTARCLAEVRGASYDQLEARLRASAAEVFGW
jgi:hypothetical protein